MYEVQATVSELQQQELVLAQEATLCLLTRTSYQNLIPEPHTRTLMSISQASKKDFQEAPAVNKANKIIMQEFPMWIREELSRQSIFKISMQGPRIRMISIAVAMQGSLGPLHDLLTRTCTRSGKDLLERISTKDLHKNMQGPVRERTPPGSPQDLLSARSCNDHLGGCQQDLRKIFS